MYLRHEGRGINVHLLVFGSLRSLYGDGFACNLVIELVLVPKDLCVPFDQSWVVCSEVSVVDLGQPYGFLQLVHLGGDGGVELGHP